MLSALGFAYWLRNPWALVLSQVTGALFQLPFSYWAHSYRPRLRIDPEALRHLLAYGRYVLGSAPLFYLSAHLDEIAIGRRYGSRSMGAYQLSYNTAALPATYGAELVSGVLFPVFAALSVYYAWGVIPSNGCRPDIYLRLLAHLGLLPAGVPGN